ncbi:MAG: right-handed parallel beta-helix repeat-containing protein [Armatimonadota bacterium]
MSQRHTLRGLVATVALGLCGATSFAAESAMVYYVAPNGNDQWSGRLAEPNPARTDGPFATLTRARDAIRDLKARRGLSRPVTVQLRGGTYYIDQTIAFTPQDSGTEQCPLSYVAYPGETPVLCGGRKITNLKPEKGQVLAAFLPEAKAGQWYFRQLFVDDQRQIRARDPNFDPSDPYRKGFHYVERQKSGFGQVVGCIHNVGDWMDYEINVPADGEYRFWVYYGALNQPHGNTDMAGRTAISVDGGELVPLMALPDTGGWSIFRWSHSATLNLKAGKHRLRWQNLKGGGLDLEAFALSDDAQWVPEGEELKNPAPGKHLLLIQAEDFVAYNGPQLTVSVGGGHKTRFSVKPGVVKADWAKLPDPEIHIFPSDCCRAFKEIVRLASVDEATGTVTVSGPECVALLRTGDRFFVENVPELLDSPGEWYLDPSTGVLRLWPSKPLSPESEVIAPAVGRLFQFTPDAEGKGSVSHLRLSGLVIKNTDYSPDDGCVGYGMGKDGAVYLEGATDCRIERCRFLNTGKYAVCIKGGERNSVVTCDIAQSAEGGVLILDSAGNTISDNYIHHCGLVYKHIGGVILQGPGASDNVVSHNLIHTMSRYGISLKNPGSRNRIEYNQMYDLNTETYDTGGIEVTQHDKEFRSHSVISHNIVGDVIGYSSTSGVPTFLSWGIYLDSYAGGYTVTDNIVYRNHNGGVMLQGGKDNVVENNILVEGATSQLYIANFQNNITGARVNRNIVYYTDPKAALIAAGALTQEALTADYNLYYCAGGGPLVVRGAGATNFDEWQKKGFDVHSVIADPLFVDPAHDNYALRPDSPAFKLGFRPISASKIGLLTKRR